MCISFSDCGRWIVLAVVSVAAGCATAGVQTPSVWPGRSPARIPTEIRVKVAGRVVSVAFEDYVLGTALSEVTPVGETPRTIERVYDVQAIVARTYAVAHVGRHAAEGFDLCDTTHCQLYEPARLGSSRFAPEARRAVARTAGQILLYGGRPIDAVFHADCGGHTASPDQVWGTAPLPYLPSEPDRAASVQHRTWTITLTRDQLRIALNGDARSAVGKTLSSISVDATDDSGRASTITLDGDRPRTLRADDFRAIVNRSLGPKGLPSTRFSLRRSGTSYVLNGTGFGHGVGLCQQGALARARQGTDASAILGSYFPGASLARLAEGRGGRIP